MNANTQHCPGSSIEDQFRARIANHSKRRPSQVPQEWQKHLHA
jgi:hypothetical protein